MSEIETQERTDIKNLQIDMAGLKKDVKTIIKVSSAILVFALANFGSVIYNYAENNAKLKYLTQENIEQKSRVDKLFYFVQDQHKKIIK